MTRKSFKTVAGVSVKDLLLDTSNARIRSGSDQADCIAKIADGKEDQLVALANDIAENGLSTAPILVKPQGAKQFVVWDGNRRVTALKLLDNPKLAPSPALRKRFENIKQRHPDVSNKVDILASAEDNALIKEVIARHAGAMEGAGQLVWSALMRTFFLTSHDQPEANKRAARLFLWAEDHGVSLPDDFPITTITRFLSKPNLQRLGFKETNSTVKPEISLEKAIAVTQRLAADFQQGGKKSVNDVFYASLADEYIDQLCIDIGLPSAPNAAQPTQNSSHPTADPKAPPNNATAPNTNTETATSASPAQTSSRPRAPSKPTWDRPKIFKGRSAGFTVPKSEVKAYNILAELGNLKTKETPLAVSALFRMLVEFSTTHYYEASGLQGRGDNTHRRIAFAAKHMHTSGILAETVKEQVLRRTTEADGMLQYNSLNQYMHAWSAHPDFQQVHVLWDELEPFLIACWSI